MVAKVDTTVLIIDESGFDKELIAKSIHQQSHRRANPFVVINCAALSGIPRHLAESALFGHERNAFPEAVTMQRGVLELAHTGTLFLNEIDSLRPDLQDELLGFLQERDFTRVGGDETIRVDVHVVAASSRDLKQMVANGSFLAPLFYRLNVVPITVPPLRERREDEQPVNEKRDDFRAFLVTAYDALPKYLGTDIRHELASDVARQMCLKVDKGYQFTDEYIQLRTRGHFREYQEKTHGTPAPKTLLPVSQLEIGHEDKSAAEIMEVTDAPEVIDPKAVVDALGSWLTTAFKKWHNLYAEARLTQNEFAITALREFDFDLNQIGELLGISTHTVRAVMSRAKARISRITADKRDSASKIVSEDVASIEETDDRKPMGEPAMSGRAAEYPETLPSLGALLPRGQLQTGTVAQQVQRYLAPLLGVSAGRVEIYVDDSILEICVGGSLPKHAMPVFKARYEEYEFKEIGTTPKWGIEMTGTKKLLDDEVMLSGREIFERIARECGALTAVNAA